MLLNFESHETHKDNFVFFDKRRCDTERSGQMSHSTPVNFGTESHISLNSSCVVCGTTPERNFPVINFMFLVVSPHALLSRRNLYILIMVCNVVYIFRIRKEIWPHLSLGEGFKRTEYLNLRLRK
jgi:hypothetical protein